ncbi:Coiled-coil domain-containing protein 77 [Cichlidogyrus casuarinus]|uniref:Coiled-coil domain-containing protein 77 n=1 Tax=Cichlidogyrus casuarinus TaxID=1844966 RepID=A0ABD2Q5S5_9PLAT
MDNFSDYLGCVFFHLVDFILIESQSRLDKRKMAALYLLYAFYFMQSSYQKVKIRVCPKSWLQFLKFVDELDEYGLYDAFYVFHRLIAFCAFEFCLNRQQLHPKAPLFNDPTSAINSSELSRSKSKYAHNLRNCTNLHQTLDQTMPSLGVALERYTQSKADLLNFGKIQKKKQTDAKPSDLTAEEYFADSDSDNDSSSEDEGFIPGLNYIDSQVSSFVNLCIRRFNMID